MRGDDNHAAQQLAIAPMPATAKRRATNTFRNQPLMTQRADAIGAVPCAIVVDVRHGRSLASKQKIPRCLSSYVRCMATPRKRVGHFFSRYISSLLVFGRRERTAVVCATSPHTAWPRSKADAKGALRLEAKQTPKEHCVWAASRKH